MSKEAGGPLIIEDTPSALPNLGAELLKLEAYCVCFLDHISEMYGMGRSLYVFLTIVPVHSTELTSGSPVVPGGGIIGEVVAVAVGYSVS